MKFFRIDLLTLLISLFILASCKNPDSIGLPVDPSKALQTTLIDTATITTATVLEDSVITNNLAKAPLSYFKDPIFGTTESNIAASLNLPSYSAYTIPTGTILIDSAVLSMRYADGFYGDSLSTKYTVNVYQLTEPLITSKSYYNTKAWNHSSTLLGSSSFFPKTHTGIKITTIVTGAADTLLKVPAQMRIKLNTAFFSTNLLTATSTQLGSNSVFQNAVKGLYLTIDKTKPGLGGTMFFNMAADTSNVDIYYRAIATDGTIDTEKVSMPLGSPHAVQIKHDYSTGTANADINAQLSNPNASYSTLYVQGLSGLRVKVGFPYLKNILAAQGANTDAVLNRAELVVTPVAGTDVPFAPTPRLTMYRYDIAKQRQLIPDAYAGDLHYISVGSFGGYYDYYHRSYHYIITGLVEDLMRGTISDYGTYIAPVDTIGTSTGSATISISNTAQVGGRTVLGGNKSSAYQMKLNILYNKVVK